jgi:hypothetical protein
MRTFDLGNRPDNDTTLTLYNTDGVTELAYNDEHQLEEPGASRIVWQAPEAGTYFLKAAQFNDAIGGSAFTYRLEVVRGIPTSTPMAKVYLPLLLR